MIRAEVHRNERDGSIRIRLFDESEPRRPCPGWRFLALFFAESLDDAEQAGRRFATRLGAEDGAAVTVEPLQSAVPGGSPPADFSLQFCY